MVSRYYSESSYNKSLRIFALKAAEKVTNLSNELDRLSVFIQQELKDAEHNSPAEALLAKNIRFEGAIHIINTLKSVNDRSLSDWQGVIGEEISARREVQEEREEAMRELLDRLESLQHATLDSTPSHHDEEREHLFAEVATIRSELRLLASQVSGVPVVPARSPRKKGKVDVQKPCPAYGHPVQCRQTSKAKSVWPRQQNLWVSKLWKKPLRGKVQRADFPTTLGNPAEAPGFRTFPTAPEAVRLGPAKNKIADLERFD